MNSLSSAVKSSRELEGSVVINIPFVKNFCGKETVLDTSSTSFNALNRHDDMMLCRNEEENSGLLSFSSRSSDDTDSSGVDSSQRKLMSTPDVSQIEMNIEKKVHNENGGDYYSGRNPCLKFVTIPLLLLTECITTYKKVILLIVEILAAVGLTAYMVLAMCRNPSRALPLCVIWVLVFIYKIYAYIRDHYGDKVSSCFRPLHELISKQMFWIKWVFIVCILAGLAVWIILDTSKRPNQLISGAGYFVFLFGLFLSSKYPDRVIWRPVLWGLLIQILFGMLILRTQAGFEAFHWLGNIVQTFINFVDAGVKFVFGNNFAEHYFAFKVLPIVIYFSSFISVLYYLGAMQWLILKIAWIMQISLNTSATESLVTAGNIFVGQTESPLLIRPYIHDLTTSELHAVMTAGFGTIAGSVLGAYLGFGIQPVYVITACFMAAPCALAISKLVFPETKTSKFMNHDGLKLDKPEQRNIIEAAFVGASQAVPLVLNIGGNLIAFLSLLAAINSFLGWFGGLMDYPQLSFELICSYLFMPVTFLMGVEWRDCFKAAELIGTKIFLNEFIAYESLADMIKLRDNGTIPRVNPDTGLVNWVDERTEAIITYALCGFANVGSLGIMLGGLGSLAPKRQSEMAKTVIRALIAGIFVSILNACVAGFLYVPKPIVCDNMLATTNWTNTEPSRLYQCCAPVVESYWTLNSTGACNCCNYNWNLTSYHLNCTSVIC